MPNQPFANIHPGCDPDAHKITANGVEMTLRAALDINRRDIHSVEIIDCHAVVTLDLPAAVNISVQSCRNLTNLHAPAAELILVDDCPNLTPVGPAQCNRRVVIHARRFRRGGHLKKLSIKQVWRP